MTRPPSGSELARARAWANGRSEKAEDSRRDSSARALRHSRQPRRPTRPTLPVRNATSRATRRDHGCSSAGPVRHSRGRRRAHSAYPSGGGRDPERCKHMSSSLGAGAVTAGVVPEEPRSRRRRRHRSLPHSDRSSDAVRVSRHTSPDDHFCSLSVRWVAIALATK